GPGGAVALAQLAADAADGAVGLGLDALLLVGAGQHDVHVVGHADDDLLRAHGGALHAAHALLPVHLRHAPAVDVDGVELAGLDAGTQPQAAEGAVQGAVPRHLHGGHAVGEAHVLVELMPGTVPAGAADKGHPALH